jgi:hypothetical protein
MGMVAIMVIIIFDGRRFSRSKVLKHEFFPSVAEELFVMWQHCCMLGL